MMRAAIWFVGLFGLAVAVALFAGSNQGIVTLFWHPYRIDVSLNMVLVALLLLFALLYAALRGFSVLLMLPHQAKHWRQQQKERKMYQALVESLSHLQAGRYVRSRKSAQSMLKLSDELRTEQANIPQDASLRAIAHMLAADSAHALRDLSARDTHYEQALEDVPINGTLQQQEVREGAQMRAARWALDDRDPQEAIARLEQLPPGASRRTMALRIQLKASRMANETQSALDTARLLSKHGGISKEVAHSIMRGLLLEQIQQIHDADQLQRLWTHLHPQDRGFADVAIAAAQKLVQVHGDSQLAREWLLPVWEQFTQNPQALTHSQILRLLNTLQQALDGLDSVWLGRIESAHRAAPHNPELQYLAGMACVQRQLWGKGEQLLQSALPRLEERSLRSQAWKALALMAEHRGDTAAAHDAWKQAALESH